MILSMTGYGKASGSFKEKKFFVELKSLNGKSVDVRYKIAPFFKEKELILRNMVIDHAIRGKIEFSISVESAEGDDEYSINKKLLKKYLLDLQSIQQEVEISNNDWISAIFRIPNVITSKEVSLSEEEWEAIQVVVIEALDELKKFRAKEGLALKLDLEQRIASIGNLLYQIKKYESARVIALRERLKRNLDDFMGKENVDKNRYEQEVIYYMEKLDINEEKVRLTQHLDFFTSELSSAEETSGRKLNFISQEMGREINTLGAKAQHADIQQLVVNMKDDLEKIKEQLANIL